MDNKKITLKNRVDFPLISGKSASGSSLIYLNSAATAQKPYAVIKAISDFYETSNANIHRGLYELGEQATVLYEQAREKIANFINANCPSEIIFTKGTTESINFIAAAWAQQHLKAGDEIVLTIAEHHANLLPWQRVAQKTGAVLKFIKLDPVTYLPENPLAIISEKTRLVAVTHSSNVLGDIWLEGQLEALIAKAHAVGAKILIDAAQSIAHRKVDIQTLNPDFLTFSGHKIFGPTGIGVLYIKKNLHDQVEPYQLGGSMVHSVSLETATWAPSPQKFEGGTPPIAGAIGLGAAIDYINQTIDFAELAHHEAALCNQLLDGLANIPGVKIAGNQSVLRKSGHLVSFAIDGIHPHDIASLLGSKNIALRAGHHCAQPLVNYLGFDSLLRVSFAIYNTPEEVKTCLQELEKTVELFGSISKK